MYLDATVNGKTVLMLIDTGSSLNLISEQLVSDLKLTGQLSQSNFKFVGVTGAPLQTMGVLRDVPVKIQRQTLNANFIVTTKMSEEVILGQ